MKNTKNVIVIGLLGFALSVNTSFAQKKPVALKKQVTKAVKSVGDLIPNDPDVRIGRLANGLTYY
ncbi:MAG: hypothetical protein EOO93_20075, partial [Pedobacter sp.]